MEQACLAMAMLLNAAADLSGARVAEVKAIAARLLHHPGNFNPHPMAQSTLNNDGSPLQVCVTAYPATRSVRLLGDPGASAKTTTERAAIGCAALDRLLGSTASSQIVFVCSHILSVIPPPWKKSYNHNAHSILWLAVPIFGDGFAIYVKANSDNPQKDWERCISLCEVIFPSHPEVGFKIANLRECAYPASVGLEIADPKHMRFKVYWRLQKRITLDSLNIGLFNDPSIHEFLIRVLGPSVIPATGLVFSTSFSLRTGRISDVKIDVCGHCTSRGSEDWLALIDSLTTDYGLANLGLSTVLSSQCADIAFIGYGLNALCEKRLNVYLKQHSFDL